MVFCEKPLSVDLGVAQPIAARAERERPIGSRASTEDLEVQRYVDRLLAG